MSEFSSDLLEIFKFIAESTLKARDEISKAARRAHPDNQFVNSRHFKKAYAEFRQLYASGKLPENIMRIVINNGKTFRTGVVMGQYNPTSILSSNTPYISKNKQSSNPSPSPNLKLKSKIEIKNAKSKNKKGAKVGGITEGQGVKELSINNILKDLQKHRHISELVDIYKTRADNIVSFINDLQAEGYNVSRIGDNYKLAKEIIPASNMHQYFNWDGNQIIKFGVVSDTHLCSKNQQLTFLNHLYDLFSQEDIDTVYHVGDLTDGYNKRRAEHIYDLFKIGADEQADYVIEKYPYRPNLKTKFITGNHDAWHTSNGGVDIGRKIAKERNDMDYLGCLNATVYLTPNCRMELNHPLDGASYALSYSIQKYIDSMSGGDKPNVLLNGHHHKFGYLFYRNIHALECGTTEAQSAWMKGKRIAAHIGGCIITLHVDKDGTIKRFMPEFIPLYNILKNDY
jgi:predicted phosphodiesterase